VSGSSPEAAQQLQGKTTVEESTAKKINWHIEQGTDVIGTCGHKIGEVMDVQNEYLVVEQGFFICHDLYVPTSAIASVDKHGLHVNVSKNQIKASGWDTEPDEAPVEKLTKTSI
jgi:hypothetical protein